MNEILNVKNVSKFFGKLKAVDHISFNIIENDIFGIAGPNGAGKTTLFNVITNIPYHADSGKILFKGKSIEFLNPSTICHLGIARTFQKEAVFPSLSVKENILIGAAFGKGIKVKMKDEQMEKIYEVLKFVGISTSKFNQNAKDLPLFEKKKLMIASALITNPKILLLDEPVSGLNKIEIKQCLDLVKKINKNGITIVLIEHVLSFLVEVSDKIMILNEGKKLVEGKPNKVLNDKRVIEAYLGGG